MLLTDTSIAELNIKHLLSSRYFNFRRILQQQQHYRNRYVFRACVTSTVHESRFLTRRRYKK